MSQEQIKIGKGMGRKHLQGFIGTHVRGLCYPPGGTGCGRGLDSVWTEKTLKRFHFPYLLVLVAFFFFYYCCVKHHHQGQPIKEMV